MVRNSSLNVENFVKKLFNRIDLVNYESKFLRLKKFRNVKEVLLVTMI